MFSEQVYEITLYLERLKLQDMKMQQMKMQELKVQDLKILDTKIDGIVILRSYWVLVRNVVVLIWCSTSCWA